MELAVAYRGRSAVVSGPAGLAVALAPNLRRDRVGFEGVLRHPIRFREAISALHEIVVSDLRYKPKDKETYRAYLAEQQGREAAIRRGATAEARTAILQSRPELDPGVMADLDRRYHRARKAYWNARQKYSNYLAQHDPELWRLLMPCDPVMTVAPDCLFFECFSADESSYGCLTVDRGAFASERDAALGTTNVDYSWALYEHFQALRSYRETRFLIDPTGFEVRTGEAGAYREEKIPLPPSWLRGFMKLQAAMSLPARRVSIGREGLYNVLAFLKRHRASKSPRAVRFELTPGRPAEIVLEPWERRIPLHARPYDGPRTETIRTWGRDRIRSLAWLLPLVDDVQVHLLGTGLPSFWSARMGDMRLLLGLSGWTANDWAGSSAIDAIAPPVDPAPGMVASIAEAFRESPIRTLASLCTRTGASMALVVASLNRLALLGQVIHDLDAGVYRWRQVMPVTLSAEQVGPVDPESAAAKVLVARGQVRVTKDECRADGLHLMEGVADRTVSVLLDADGRMLRGRCDCSHHFTGGFRKGPCRHLQALRSEAWGRTAPPDLEAWFSSVVAGGGLG